MLRTNISDTRHLILAGFHRSGTSLVAQLLHRSGLFLGYDLLGQHRSNRHGHFEDREIMRLHDSILADNGLTWQMDGSSLPVVREAHRAKMREISEKRNAEPALWGFKDPRACLFLDDWKVLLPNAKVLIVYRNFADAVQSLHRRAAGGLAHGTGDPDYHRAFQEVPDLALKMWLAYNKALLVFAEAYPQDVMAVSQEMLARGLPLVEVLNKHWSLGLAPTPIAEVFDAAATTGREGKQPVADESLVSQVLETWEVLERLGAKTANLAGFDAPDQQVTEEDFQVEPVRYELLIKNEFLGFEVDALRESLVEKKQVPKKQGRQNVKKDVRKAKERATSRRREKPALKDPLLEAGQELAIVYPHAGNVFYDMLARRLKAACDEVALNAETHSAEAVSEMKEGRLDDATVAIVQPYQCYFGLRNGKKLTQRISEAKKRVAVAAESVETEFFENQFTVPIQFDALLDVGFVSQEDKLKKLEGFEIPYRLLLHGPTLEDRQRIERTATSERKIPWTTVGHDRPVRSQLVRDLVQSFDPGGFVFLPPKGVIVNKNRGTISPGSLDALLQKSQYYVWQSLHEFAYYESFRFREALLAGAAPCKIDADAGRWRAEGIPGVFPSVESFIEVAQKEGFESIRESAKEFYLSRGLLSEHLEKVLSSD